MKKLIILFLFTNTLFANALTHNQIDAGIKKYPNDKQYVQIKQHLNNGSYR